MTEQLAHETLYTIRARVAALQATLEEAQEEEGKANAALITEMADNDRLRAELKAARAELTLLRADKVDLDAVMAQNVEVDSLRAELDAARWRITELEAANES